jgi:hypothetical protein
MAVVTHRHDLLEELQLTFGIEPRQRLQEEAQRPDERHDTRDDEPTGSGSPDHFGEAPLGALEGVRERATVGEHDVEIAVS